MRIFTLIRQEMTPAEKETRLEAILPDTTSLCVQIERQAETLTALLNEADAEQPVEGSELDARIEGEVFVLQQASECGVPDRVLLS